MRGRPLAGVLIFGLFAVCLLSAGANVAHAAVTVTIPDSGLEAAIRDELGKDTDEITDADMRSLLYLDAADYNIANLTGLEGATSLEELYLEENQILSVAAIAGLTELTVLDLSYNHIADVTPVAGLANLQGLYLDGNNVSDIAPVAGLTKLQELSLYLNQVADITAVAGLSNLSYLDLENNDIVDIAAVDGLANLAVLFVEDNYLDLAEGSSSMTTISALQSRGVYVGYSPQRAAFTITPTAGPNGRITPGTVQRVPAGRDCTFTITPDPLYHVADVQYGRDLSAGAVTSYTFKNVKSNKTISASFALNRSAIGCESGSNFSFTFGSPFLVRGSLAGLDSQHRLLPGEHVVLQSAAPGAEFRDTSRWTITGADGRWNFWIRPTTMTWYRVRFPGSANYPPSVGYATFAKPRVRLTRSTSWSSLRQYKTYYARGYIEPRHYNTEGRVTIRVYKRASNGKYYYKKSFTSYYRYHSPTKTRYIAKVRLTSKGRYKLVARHQGDMKNATTSGSIDYVTVK